MILRENSLKKYEKREELGPKGTEKLVNTERLGKELEKEKQLNGRKAKNPIILNKKNLDSQTQTGISENVVSSVHKTLNESTI